ncbi:Histidine--tRNA ligase [Candidatus Hydrogenisulfobacillus filiaventi]|uniref:Histidine--tRNA ligase n=1 Tax=Candidatus Hydrogenisulfobacillus filiaventi TaxID=2707344 RepID=A0A6F8ZIJ0_9FIRM|nr:histidine--tRNA ligase [Bacillota bacterium]CAB1129699.1 Histidine--tRNA ligase [Candidatus Hydrogenisulfobacillus filiaventi]
MRVDLQRPRGTFDVLPPQGERIEAMRRLAFERAWRYGFRYIETPVFEQSGVFARVGETTDIVQHERYRFVDAGGIDLTLRPEGTAAVARLYVEHGLANGPQPVKLFYWAPMFRRERPEAGRFRQHTQFGAELYGSERPEADAEVILLATDLVEALGLTDPVVRVNSLGCPVCRPRYREALTAFYRSRAAALCHDCRERLDTNPLRLLDCKVDVDLKAEAPDIADYWCSDCRVHFERLTGLLEGAGRRVRRDPQLVRGLDYYTRTVFEVGHPSLGEGVALFGGGRYDGLTAGFDGPPVPAVGFGMGVERILSAVPDFAAPPIPAVYVAALDELRDEAFRWARTLRQAGVAAEVDLMGRSLKAQMKEAARRAGWVLILGAREWEAGQVTLRNLADGTQEVLELEGALDAVRARVGL